MNIDYKAIGVRIKAARARKGVTQGCLHRISVILKQEILN